MEPAAQLPDFDALWDFSKPEETEREFRKLLPAAETGSDVAYRMELLTQIARTLGLQKKFEAAHAVLDRVEGLLATHPHDRSRIRILLERGRAFNSSGSPATARPLFIEAWERGRASGEDNLAVDAAHMVAIVKSGDESHAWNLKAMRLAEESADPKAKKWLGSLYNNMGWTYHDQKEYEPALDMFQKALAWREERRTPGPLRIAKWCVARTYRSLGRLHEARDVQRRLLEEFEADGEDDGYVQEEMGECLLALGDPTQARPYFSNAYTLLSKDAWLPGREPERIERLRTLGQE